MSTLAEALAPRSDQLNADDLIPGPRVLKITNAKISSEERQKKIVLNFEGDQGKPWKPCKTMGRAMVIAWAITEESQFVGKHGPRLSRSDREVRRPGRGWRHPHQPYVAHRQAGNDELTVSQGKKATFTFHPLVAEAPANNGIDAARRAIAAAPTLDALKIVWSSKAMAPFRDALQQDLDDRKAALSFEPEGRATEDTGEGFTDNGRDALFEAQ